MMGKENEANWKQTLDNILIYNLYILILGSLFLFISFVLSVNGNSYFYMIFQKLWFPIFIPSLSLFFTAISVEAVMNSLWNKKNK